MPRWAQFAAVAAGLTLAIATDLASPIADASNTVNYTYDAWGRVSGATYQGSGNLTTGYTYDPAGNRTQTATGATPIANPIALTVNANSSNNVAPLSVAGPYTSASVATNPSHGTASATGTTVKYTPTTGYTGADSFAYKVANTAGSSGSANVSVIVLPVANAANATVSYNSSNNPITYTVTGTYASVALASRPANGAATASGTSLTYTPNASYFGSDSFQYVASIAQGSSAPASVSITVNPPPPIANPVSAQVGENSTSNNIPLSITGGTPTSVAVSTQATHGTATASGVTISYTPAANYTGSDSFAYTASNAGGTSSPATASLTVSGLTATASATLNCPSVPYTYVCATGTGSSFTFTGMNVSVAVQYGSGSYTYVWAAVNQTNGTWTSGGTGSSATPSVSGVGQGLTARADYQCTVTDTVTHQQVTSNVVTYRYTHTGT